MPFADVRGNLLHYELEGDAALPVVALSNSLGADISMWDAQMPDLIRSFRVLRYDTRGHGRSALPIGRTDLAALGQDLLSLLDALAIDRAHLCGVSLGGLTAMWVAIHASDRLHSLVLSNTAAKIGNEDGWNERISAVKAGGLQAIADAVPTRWFTSAFLADGPRIEAQRQMLLRCSPEGYIEASNAIRDSDLCSTTLNQITVPTLVLSGAEDKVTPPSEGLALQVAISGARFRELPGAHLCNIEYPEPYSQALLSFLEHQAPYPDERHSYG